MHHQHVAAGDCRRNRREIPQRVIGHVLGEKTIHRKIAHSTQHQRVAVGRGFGGELTSERTVSTGAIVDYHHLAQRIGQLGRHNACNRIDAATRRLRCNQADRFLRPVIGLRAGAACSAGEHQRSQQSYSSRTGHAYLLKFCG